MVLSWLLSLSSATGKTCEYIFFKPIISIIFAEGQGGHKQPMLMSHTHTHSMIMWKRAWYVRMIKRGHINYDLSLIFLSFGAFIVCMNGFMRCINVRCAISMECRMMHHAWMQTSECWKTSTAHWRNLKGTITLSLLHESCNVFAVIFEAEPNDNGEKKYSVLCTCPSEIAFDCLKNWLHRMMAVHVLTFCCGEILEVDFLQRSKRSKMVAINLEVYTWYERQRNNSWKTTRYLPQLKVAKQIYEKDRKMSKVFRSVLSKISVNSIFSGQYKIVEMSLESKSTPKIDRKLCF